MILRYADFELKVGVPPTKEHDLDAGWDLYSIENRVLMPGESHRFQIGLVLWFEPTSDQLARMDDAGTSWYGRLADKSGMANKHGIHILGGVVDRGYMGEVGIVLANLGFIRDGVVVQLPWRVKPGEVLCQIVPTVILDVREAAKWPYLNLPETDRGARGFTSG